MQFDVCFAIDVEDGEHAAEEVATWRVTPGAVLKFIVSSQPLTVTSMPQKIGADGEVGEIKTDATPEAIGGIVEPDPLSR